MDGNKIDIALVKRVQIYMTRYNSQVDIVLNQYVCILWKTHIKTLQNIHKNWSERSSRK